MKIPDGTRVGWLVDDQGNKAAEVRLGKIMQLGPVKGYALWKHGKGFVVLFSLPSIIPGLVVTKDAISQAGAFLLKPDQSFSLSNHGIDNTYQFKVIQDIKIQTKMNDHCDFCRSPFTGKRARYCLSSILESESAVPGLLLCNGCYAAWGSSEIAM
jgi:hypothetical protein